MESRSNFWFASDGRLFESLAEEPSLGLEKQLPLPSWPLRGASLNEALFGEFPGWTLKRGVMEEFLCCFSFFKIQKVSQGRRSLDVCHSDTWRDLGIVSFFFKTNFSCFVDIVREKLLLLSKFKRSSQFTPKTPVTQ